MRKVFCALGLAALMVLLADVAQAQRFGGGFQRGGVALLSNKSVQEELKISDEQKTKIEELVKDARTKREDVVGKVDFKDKESRTKYAEALKDEKNKEKLAKIEADEMKAALDVLKPEQQKRFKQINRQQMRLAAFTNDEVVKELGISAEQKEKIKTIVNEIEQDVTDLRKTRSKDSFQKIASLNKEGMDKVTAILTDDQKSKWKEMIGEPFEVRFDFGNFKGKGKGKGKNE